MENEIGKILDSLLENIQDRKITKEELSKKISELYFEDIGFAKVDHHRELRRGFPEVIFGAGKSKQQIIEIARRLLKYSDRLLITKTNKEERKKGKILVINAVKEVKQDKNIAFLKEKHIENILEAYRGFTDIEGFCKLVTNEEVLGNKASLNIAQYVSNVDSNSKRQTLSEAIQNWRDSGMELEKSMNELFNTIG